MWDLPGPEIEPMSPVLAGGFFTAEPPGKPGTHFERRFYFLVLSLIGMKIPHQVCGGEYFFLSLLD